MARYRKKPVVIDAEELIWENWGAVCDLAGVGRISENKPEGCHVDESGNVTTDPNGKIGLQIPTLEGTMLGKEGDFIIKGVEGEIYPCKPDIFAKTYELVE